MTGVSALNRVVGNTLRALHARVITPVRIELLRGLFGVRGAADAAGRLPMSEVVATLRRLGAHIGDRACIKPGLRIDNAEGDLSSLWIGDNVHIGNDVFIDLTAPVRLEDDVAVASNVSLVTHFDTGDRPLAQYYARRSGPVVISRGAMIGTGVVILHGVTVGAAAVVGALSLVHRNVPPGHVVAGNPARVVRVLAAADSRPIAAAAPQA